MFLRLKIAVWSLFSRVYGIIRKISNMSLTPEARDQAGIGTAARLLTEPERESFKQAGVEVVADKPQLLYLTGKRQPLNDIKNTPGLAAVQAMIQNDKVLLFASRRINREVQLPTLNEAIDLLVQQESSIQYFMDRFGHLKLDRSAVDKQHLKEITGEEEELAQRLSHSVDWEFCRATPPRGQKEHEKTFQEIVTYAPPKFSSPFYMRIALEKCSIDWLEPYFRSRRHYDEDNFDRENTLNIFEDPEVLARMIAADGKYGSLQRTIDGYFNGDEAAFRGRWKEYHQNWWPGEYRAMQEATDNMKNWLKTQKE